MSTTNQLKDCPASPNCVCTTDVNPKKQMTAMPFEGTGEAAKEKLKALISGMPRTKLVKEETNYLHYEFVTLLGRFTDDVEFLLNEQEGKIHFRSASRVGYSDLGANRRRMKKISKAWKER